MRLVEQLRWWASECDRTNFGCQARKLLIEAAEALEKAEPVRHGRWETHNQVDSVFYCSECKLNVSGFERRWLNYCPNCGAKMDKENDNADS